MLPYLNPCEIRYDPNNEAAWRIKTSRFQGFKPANINPMIHCKAFEDNTGALELSLVPKMRPRTRHINNVYHHFRQIVRDGLIRIGTEDQVADIFTKPLSLDVFMKHRKSFLGY